MNNNFFYANDNSYSDCGGSGYFDDPRLMSSGNYPPFQSPTFFSDNNTSRYDHGFDFTQTDYFRNGAGNNVFADMHAKLDELKSTLKTLQDESFQKLAESQQFLSTETVNIHKEEIIKCFSVVNFYKISKIKQRCKAINLDFDTLEKHIQTLIDVCTKDNICNGKTWIIEQSTKSNESCQQICNYLLTKVSMSTVFSERLHIVYLINDLLHYCKRKSATCLLEAIESSIVNIYSMCLLLAEEDGRVKLSKVLTLWESNSYTRSDILVSLKSVQSNPTEFFETWRDKEIADYQKEEDDGCFRDLAKPNNETISLCLSDAKLKLNNLEANHNQLKYELKIKEEAIQLEIYQLERDIKLAESEQQPIVVQEIIQPNYQMYADKEFPPMNPVDSYDIGFHMPDVTRPPPGFPVIDGVSPPNTISIPPPAVVVDNCFQPVVAPTPTSTIATVDDQQHQQQPTTERATLPFWRLPAAVMVTQIRLGQYDYAPIDAKSIQLPTLRQPTKTLIDITNSFYLPPSHDRPRDIDGWEKLGLHDFYRMKEKAKNGELPDDFIASLYVDKHVDENMMFEYGDDYRMGGGIPNRMMMITNNNEEEDDYTKLFPNPTRMNNDFVGGGFRHESSMMNTLHPQPRGGVGLPNNQQRSLLGGSPWDDYHGNAGSSRQFAPEMAPARSIGGGYSGVIGPRPSPSLLGAPPPSQQQNQQRHVPPKVTPLMSLELSTNFKRHHQQQQRGGGHRNSSYSGSNKRSLAEDDYDKGGGRSSRRRYSSRSRSPYDRSRSPYSRSPHSKSSKSRSRSQRYSYSRSRSRSYSRSRSRSRNSSRSSNSSNDKRPYRGGYIAKRSHSRSSSRSRSYSRSPPLLPPPISSSLSKPDYDNSYSQNNKRPWNPDNRMRSDQQQYMTNKNIIDDEQFSSRFRQRRPINYSEWPPKQRMLNPDDHPKGTF